MITNKESIERMSSSHIEILNSSEKDLSNESKIETFYTSIMCFVANLLSSIALETVTKSSLGNSVTKSTTFSAYFRRNCLKINILVTNAISGTIATVMLMLGDKYKYPYLYIPWLLNTIKGMALFEGPALLNTAYKFIPYSEVPAGFFMLITFILFIEEIFLWSDVFSSFRQCWILYDNRNRRTIHTLKEKFKIKKMKLLSKVNKTDVDFKFHRMEICNQPSESEVELSKIFRTNTNLSNESIVPKVCNSETD